MAELPEQDMMIGIRNVGAGWRPLIRKLVLDLNKTDVAWQPQQVKEKFGGLRFYISVDGTNEEHERLQQMVSDVEAESYRLCEVCGAPPVPQTAEEPSWIQTLCQEHRDQRMKNREQFLQELKEGSERSDFGSA